MGKYKQKTSGFTVIEVLIVLGIMGLLMFIIFLAVPALNRNSRNSARRKDAAIVLTAVHDFEQNNGWGNQIDLRSDPNSSSSFDIALDSDYVSYGPANIRYDVTKLYYYNVSSDSLWGQDAGSDTTGWGITISSGPEGVLPTISLVTLTDNNPSIYVVNTEKLAVMVGVSCNSTNTGPGSLVQNVDSVYYAVETTGSGIQGMKIQCLDDK